MNKHLKLAIAFGVITILMIVSWFTIIQDDIMASNIFIATLLIMILSLVQLIFYLHEMEAQ